MRSTLHRLFIDPAQMAWIITINFTLEWILLGPLNYFYKLNAVLRQTRSVGNCAKRVGHLQKKLLFLSLLNFLIVLNVTHTKEAMGYRYITCGG